MERKMKNAGKILKKTDFAEHCMKQIISKKAGIVRNKKMKPPANMIFCGCTDYIHDILYFSENVMITFTGFCTFL